MNAVTYITLTPPQLEEVARKAAFQALQQAARAQGDVMTLSEVARHFNICTKTVAAWERLGKIPLRKNGRWRRADILAVSV